MKRFILSSVLLATGAFAASAQEGNIKFSEYDLPNGLHVILHEDHTTPIVSVSVMYHVGSKNEDPKRTGFAHFFEHLMFEGTDNIQREEYAKLVQNNGGVLNANTSQDRTYYFEQLPSNQLELGLWLESERMLHAKIDSVGIETQRKVVKEEKKQSYDNDPYGMWMPLIFENAFTKHPYSWTPIGKEQYIDQAKYDEFMDFYKTFYVPDNAALVIAGDFKPEQAKEWIVKYFGDIPKSTKAIPRPTLAEPEQTKEKRVKYNAQVQLAMVVLAYHSPKPETDDYYALAMLNQLLSQGASSRLQKQVVDKDQKAVNVGSFNFPLEDPGLVITLGIAAKDVSASELEKAMKAEIEKVKTKDIPEAEFQKLRNQAENDFVSQNGRIAGIAETLATNYTYFRNTNLINTELARYQKITAADLKRVANKYLTKDNSVVLHYVPKGM
ncbi:MAG: insulinase family protein [Chitinophagaceae bacterium]|nr:MAG: insulinase family protein [Chitinophagaceae bacterium]